MPVVGRAQLLVEPTFTGAQTKIGRQAKSLGRAGGQQFGQEFSTNAQGEVQRSMGSRIFSGFKTAAAVTGAAAGGILAYSIQRGFSRLNAIEQAQAKLRGLGHDAEAITAIMTSALASVKGTAFGMDEAATAAASAVAAGIKPGQQLTAYLKLTADAATIAGSSFSDMGRIINQVTTAGRAQTEDLNMLAERGIPIYQWLADQYGVTALELRKMVSEGKVDSATFRKAIQENIGGAALESGATTQGAFKNMQASLGRIGANLLAGAFPQIRGGFVAITNALAPLESHAKVVGVAFGNMIGWVVAAIKRNGPSITGFFRDLFGQMKSNEAGSVGNSLRRIGDAFRDMWPAVKVLRDELPSVQGILGKLATGASWLADHATILRSALIALAAGFVIYKAAQIANQVVGRNSVAGFALQIGSTLALAASNRALARSQLALIPPTAATTAVQQAQTRATVAQAVAGRAAAVVARMWAAGQWLLNAALVANPIGIVVVAIAALVAGLIYAYRNSETFRKVVTGAFSAVGAAGVWLWEKAIKPAFGWIVGGFRAVGGFIGAAWRTVIRPVFELFGAIVAWLAVKVFRFHMRAMETAWRGVGALIGWGYRTLIAPVFSAFGAIGRWLWEKALRPAWDATRNAWDRVSGKIKSGYDKTIRPVIDALGTRVRGTKEIFERAVDAIGEAWDGLRSVARKPVRFVIDVLNALIGAEDGSGGGFNKLAVKFKTSTIPRIPVPRILEGAARGGILAGRSSARDGDSVPIMARPGEGWTVTEALRDPYERARLLALNKAALRGESAQAFRRRWDGAGGYFLGGIVPMSGASWARHTRGYPWARWAGDGNWPGREDYGAPVTAWKDGTVASVRSLTTSYGKHVRINHGDARTLYAHLSGFAVRPGQRVRAGQLIGRVGSTGNSSGPHLHFELQGGSNVVDDSGAKSGGVLDRVVDWFKNMRTALSGPLRRLRGMDGSPISQFAAQLPQILADRMMERARGWVGGSGGINRYAGGTGFARRGLAVVGERGPELVNFRGGEQVAANKDQVSAFGMNGPVELRGTLDLGNGLSGYVRGILSETADRRDLAAAHRANLVIGR